MTPRPDVPGFEVERRLGAGASCEVWLARERDGLRRPVALKVFAGPAGSPSASGAREAWARELEVVRRVEEIRRETRCAALVQSLGAGEVPALAFIAFEWLEGGTLAERVAAGGPLPFAEAVAAVRDAAAAVALLHARGLFHRDLKPSNLLLGADGGVRVADFGLSRPLDGTLSAAGSPAFAAPEVIAGRPRDGRRLDVYSLGATLAWLLTGEAMLPGRPDVFLLERHGVPRPLQRVIVDAMAADPDERIATADALAAALEAACAPAPAPETASAPAGPGPARPAAAPGDELRRRARELVEEAGRAAASMPTLPGSERLALLPLHVTLAVGLGELHGCALDRRGATALVERIAGAVGDSYVGSAATTVARLFLPGATPAAQQYAETVALGAVIDAFFARGGELDEAELRRLHAERLAAARRGFDPARAGGLRPAERRAAERLVQLERLLRAGLITPDDHAATARRIVADAEQAAQA